MLGIGPRPAWPAPGRWYRPPPADRAHAQWPGALSDLQLGPREVELQDADIGQRLIAARHHLERRQLAEPLHVLDRDAAEGRGARARPPRARPRPRPCRASRGTRCRRAVVAPRTSMQGCARAGRTRRAVLAEAEGPGADEIDVGGIVLQVGAFVDMAGHDIGERRERSGEQLRGDRLRETEDRRRGVGRSTASRLRNTSRPKFCSLRHSSNAENATSAAPKSRPSCHFTPPRSVSCGSARRHSVSSRSPTTSVLPSAPRSNSGSITLRATRNTPLLAAIAGFQLRYSELAATRSTPPRRGACA